MDLKIKQFIDANGCFCGGSGSYTDYNCGAEFLAICPHYKGTGKISCACETSLAEMRKAEWSGIILLCIWITRTRDKRERNFNIPTAQILRRKSCNKEKDNGG